MADEALRELKPRLRRLYAKTGRPSIAPEKLLRALLLQVLYSVCSERMLMEQLDHSLRASAALLSHRGAGTEPVALFRHIQAHLAEFPDQASRPAIDIVLAHQLSHALHAQLLFFGLHLQGGSNRLRSLIDVVRIDLKRVAQFAGGARKAAENEHTALVVSRGHKFLRHQVHAIMQRGHQAQIRGAVIRLNLFVTVLPVQQDDRLPLIGLESPVDAVRLRLHLRLQVVITLDVGAARSANLNERKDALIARILFQKALDGQKAFQNPLRIVHPVDAYAHQSGLDTQAF